MVNININDKVLAKLREQKFEGQSYSVVIGRLIRQNAEMLEVIEKLEEEKKARR